MLVINALTVSLRASDNKSYWGYGTLAVTAMVALLQVPKWASIAQKLYAVSGTPSRGLRAAGVMVALPGAR